MTDYKETYEELKKNINEDNSKIIAFLILGVLAGRVYEKLQRVKKNVFKGRCELISSKSCCYCFSCRCCFFNHSLFFAPNINTWNLKINSL